MRASRFNSATPITGTGETFLFNSLTDTQIVVSDDVLALMDRAEAGVELLDFRSREAVDGRLSAVGGVRAGRGWRGRNATGKDSKRLARKIRRIRIR